MEPGGQRRRRRSVPCRSGRSFYLAGRTRTSRWGSRSPTIGVQHSDSSATRRHHHHHQAARTLPSRAARMAGWNRRRTAMRRPTVRSAVASVSTSGVVPIRMARRRQLPMSMWSNPTDMVDTTASCGPVAIWSAWDPLTAPGPTPRTRRVEEFLVDPVGQQDERAVAPADAFQKLTAWDRGRVVIPQVDLEPTRRRRPLFSGSRDSATTRRGPLRRRQADETAVRAGRQAARDQHAHAETTCGPRTGHARPPGCSSRSPGTFRAKNWGGGGGTFAQKSECSESRPRKNAAPPECSSRCPGNIPSKNLRGNVRRECSESHPARTFLGMFRGCCYAADQVTARSNRKTSK